MEYLGVVQVPLSCLYYLDNLGGRRFYEEHSNHLEDLFRGTAIDHSNQRHWVDGYIDSAMVSSVLQTLGLSLVQLQQRNLYQDFPWLTNIWVAYTQGRHRIEAAKNINDSSIWTIRLFHTEMRTIGSNHLVRKRTEQYQHERPHSDGQIYSKLREHEENDVDFCEWFERFSKTKKRAFQWIDKRPAIASALNGLIQFPGIIESLQLGSWIKYFDWRLDDELHCGLRQIYESWSEFTYGNHSVQKSLDKEAVELLEGRSPCVSKSDQQLVRTVFESGEFLGGVKDLQQRRELRQRIASSVILIPGIKSLQSNMLYLGIAAEILWLHLIPKELRKRAKSDHMTLRSTMQACWSSTVAYVEVKEGEFQAVVGPPSFDLAYLVIMLAALRQFPHLSGWKPKADTGRLFTDPNCISLFHRRAKLLGFHTWNIDQGVEVPAPPFEPCAFNDVLKEGNLDNTSLPRRMDYRYGRPHLSVFRLIQENAFLPNLVANARKPDFHITFFLKELIRTFFGLCAFELNMSEPPILINERQRFSRNQITNLKSSRQVLPYGYQLETINEEATDTCMLSPHMDVDSPSSGESDAIQPPSPHNLDVSMHDDASASIAEESEIGNISYSTNHEADGDSHSSMSWEEESCSITVDHKSSRNGVENNELSPTSAFSRSRMPSLSLCNGSNGSSPVPYMLDRSSASAQSRSPVLVPPMRGPSFCSTRSNDHRPERQKMLAERGDYMCYDTEKALVSPHFSVASSRSAIPATRADQSGLGEIAPLPYLSITSSRSTIPTGGANQVEIREMPNSPHLSIASSRSTIPTAGVNQAGVGDIRNSSYLRAISSQSAVPTYAENQRRRDHQMVVDTATGGLINEIGSSSAGHSTTVRRRSVDRKSFDSRQNESYPARLRYPPFAAHSVDHYSSGTSTTTQSRSPFPSPPTFSQPQDFPTYLTSSTKRDRPSSGWQGFIDSDDDMVSIDL